MIPASLTSRRIALENGGTAHPFEWNGETVAVLDNADNALQLYALFKRTDMGEQEKAEAIIPRLFADPQDAYCACDYSPAEFGRLVNAAMWEIFGINTGNGYTDEPVWDPEEDAAMIRTSLRMAYGIEWDGLRTTIPWAEFLALIGGLPFETPLGRAMYYRNAGNRPEKTKYNGEQVREFDRLHRLFALKKDTGSQDRVEASNNAMNDLALAMRKG